MKTHLAVGAASLLVAAGPTFAGLEFTWNGTGGDALFATGGNWVGGVAPPLDLAGGNLIFGPTGAAQSPDAAADDYVNILNLSFTGADASLTLVGTGKLVFQDNGSLVNDSALLQTINIDLAGSGAGMTINAASGDFAIGGDILLGAGAGVALSVLGSHNTTISGIISGTGGSVLKDGTGTLTLTGNNTFTGGFTLAAGTLVLGHDSALGTGDLLLTGNATIQSDNDARRISNNFDLNDGTTLTVSGANDLELSGTFSGGGALNINMDTADTALTLSGTEGYSGGTTFTRGTVVLGSNSALGNGDVTLAGDFALQSSADDRAFNVEIDTAGHVLTFSGDHGVAVDGVISGTGSLNVNFSADDDTLTLDFNSYSGGTTLTRGTVLLASNAAFGTGDVTLAGDASIQSNNDFRGLAVDFDTAGHTLTISGANGLALNGVISGAGGINVNLDNGEDVVTLGANTYTGATTLSAGTVLLADDTAFGTGAVSLAGAFTLQSGSDSRNVANSIDTGGSVLTVSGDLDLTLSGIISGNGGLTVDTGGTLTLTKENTFTGATTIDAGVLILQTASVGGDVNVNDGGTLEGTNPNGGNAVGGNLTVLDGGTVAPGLSIGTMGVGGNFDLQDGGTLDVQMSFDGTTAAADLLDVTGTATLAAGSTVNAVLDSSSYLPSGLTFEIINADGGITDNGATVNTNSATVTVELRRDQDFTNGDNSWGIEVFRADNAYSAAAPAGNPKAIGNGLDSLIPVANANPTGSAAGLLATLDALPSAAYGTTVAQLSPEPYNALTTMGKGGARDYTTQQVTYLAGVRSGVEAMPTPAPPPIASLALSYDDPLIMAGVFAMAQQGQSATGPTGTQPRPHTPEPKWGRFFKVDGVFIDQDTTGDITGFKSDGFGGQFGVDYRFSEEVVAGMSFGYMYSNADLNEGLGDLTDQALRLGPYMSWASGNWYVDGSASFAWHFYDGNRNIPSLGTTADSNYDGYDFTAYLGTGYHINLDWDFYLTPIASLLYSHFHFDDFTETGAGGANLNVASRDNDSLQSRLGANLSYRFANLQWQPIPYVYAGWQHEFIDDNDLEASFAAGGSPFTINVGNPANDALFIGGGVNLLINPNVAAFFRIESVVADETNGVGVSIGASVAF